MSCNPSIGGIGKGVLVREVDALDGLMGRAADSSGLMFKVLNRSRGPAVYGPRAQIDRDLYRTVMQQTLHGYPNLHIMQGQADDLLTAPLSSLSSSSPASSPRASVTGLVLTGGEVLESGCVVLTTGTFLSGVLHIGPTTRVLGGRYGEDSSYGLSHTLRHKLGLSC